VSTMTAAMGAAQRTGPGRARAVAVEGQAGGLGCGQSVAVTMSVTLGVAVAGYGLAGSYVTVSRLAAQRGVPLAGLVPAGIDGGLVAVVVLDLVLAWIGMPLGWLRQLVRVLSVGTVVANAAGGWPDPVAVGLHAAAPLMLLAMIEVGRTVLLRRMARASGTLRDAIPLARWLLAPWRTCLLWRRSVLWQITSYREAVDAELALRRAIALLRARYGRRWRHCAPADLVWMLSTGTHVTEACARVQTLLNTVEADAPAPCAPAAGDVDPAASGGTGRSMSGQLVSEGSEVESVPVGSTERDRFGQAVLLNREHWVETGRPISAETLRKLQVEQGGAKGHRQPSRHEGCDSARRDQATRGRRGAGEPSF
jgi:hypothetical protein